MTVSQKYQPVAFLFPLSQAGNDILEQVSMRSLLHAPDRSQQCRAIFYGCRAKRHNVTSRRIEFSSSHRAIAAQKERLRNAASAPFLGQLREKSSRVEQSIVEVANNRHAGTDSLLETACRPHVISTGVLAEPFFNHGAIGLKVFGCFCLKAKNQSRLRIGCADQSPAVGKLNPNSIHIDDG